MGNPAEKTTTPGNEKFVHSLQSREPIRVWSFTDSARPPVSSSPLSLLPPVSHNHPSSSCRLLRVSYSHFHMDTTFDLSLIHI